MKGDGSIYEHVDRQGRLRWVAQVSVAGRTTPVRRWLPPGADKKAAQRKLRELRDQRARGELDKREEKPAPVALPTLAEWLRSWYAEGAPGGRKRKGPGRNTLDLYERLIRCDIAPDALGSLRLDQIKRRDARAMLDRLAARGRARGTLQKELSLLGRAYRWAQMRFEDEIGERANPFDGVTLPATRDAATRRALAVAETRILFQAVGTDRLLPAWARLGVDSCARPGELAALRWADLDLSDDERTVTIIRGIAWEKADQDEPDGSESAEDAADDDQSDERARTVPRLTETKTGTPGHRRLTISPGTVEALKSHKRQMAAERLSAPGYWPDEQDGIDLTDLVFRTERGALVDHHYLRRRLNRAGEDAGIGRVNPYDLRHTGATLIWERKGYDAAARALGHVQGGSTAGYLHGRLATFDSTVLDAALAEDDDNPTEAAQ
jgi:integrase